MNNSKATILVVDDSTTNKEYLIQVLKGEHYRVLEAANGFDALLVVEREHPDLIITDILMPVMDGYEMVLNLKRQQPNLPIKIIFSTAQYQEKNVLDLAKMFGVSYCLSKPAPKDKIIETVELTLKEAKPKKLSREELDKISEKHSTLLNDKIFQKIADLEKINSELELRISERTSELQILNKKLEKKSLLDPLTGLHNRRYLDEILIREISRAKRRNQRFSVIMIDIDHFKLINDHYGHRVGDVVLATIAEVIKQSTRTEDVACRYGGEEFIIILFDINPENTVNRMELLRKKIESLNINAFGTVVKHHTVSMGISFFPADSENINILIEASDQALYKAKELGRNRIISFENAQAYNVASEKLITFSLEEQRYGISNQFVNKIIRAVEITPVANAAKNILGIINLHGEVIPVIDLSVKLGYAKRPLELEDYLIIVDLKGHHSAFVAKEVNYIEIQKGSMVSIKDIVDGNDTILKDNQTLIQIIDIEKIVGQDMGQLSI